MYEDSSTWLNLLRLSGLKLPHSLLYNLPLSATCKLRIESLSRANPEVYSHIMLFKLISLPVVALAIASVSASPLETRAEESSIEASALSFRFRFCLPLRQPTPRHRGPANSTVA
jgi:hypothetical protein